MGRFTGISGFVRVLRAGSAAVVLSAAIVSCSDSATAPSSALSPRNPALDGVKVVAVQVPDALKRPWLHAAGNRMIAPRFSSDAASDASAPSAPSVYTVNTLPWSTPEQSPSNVLIGGQPQDPSIDCGDCVAFHVPIGFAFTFYGNTYTELDVSSNGLVGFGGVFGTENSPQDGCCSAWSIPSNDATAMYNNIIALAWTDWTVSESAPVTVETQGTAPNRKFVLQFNNVPEYIPGTGHLTAQLVLSEGSNDITMYTTWVNVTNEWHMLTQGIQNADGSEAAFLPGRVQDQFVLDHDAIRFRINRHPITIVPAPNVEVGTDARVCIATVAITQPTVSGGGEGLTVVGTRSDRGALDAAYPKGSTIITWAATDAAGETQFASQTVTVVDREAPQITLPANVVVGNAPGLATAYVTVGEAFVEDNCPNFSNSVPPNGVYPVGVSQVVWTATDEAGNIGHATQLVTVKDIEAPTISGVPSDLTVNATSPAGALVSVAFAPFAHDNVGVTSFSCDRASGTQFRIGTTRVSCAALDAAGNKSLPASFTVTVLGAPQQIVDLIESIKPFLPIEIGDDDHHGDNDRDRDDRGWNDNRRKHQPVARRGSGKQHQLFNALSSALTNSRSSWGACQALNVIALQVRLYTPSVFPAANSAQILADIARIKNVLACRYTG